MYMMCFIRKINNDTIMICLWANVACSTVFCPIGCERLITPYLNCSFSFYLTPSICCHILYLQQNNSKRNVTKYIKNDKFKNVDKNDGCTFRCLQRHGTWVSRSDAHSHQPASTNREHRMIFFRSVWLPGLTGSLDCDFH